MQKAAQQRRRMFVTAFVTASFLLLIAAFALMKSGGAILGFGGGDAPRPTGHPLLADELLNEMPKEMRPLACGGNCMKMDCPKCPCGAEPSYVVVDDWCRQFGSEWAWNCCRCMAGWDSHGNTRATYFVEDRVYNESVPVGKRTGVFEIGVLPVNEMHWDTCNGGDAPCDAAASFRCAQQLVKRSRGTFKPFLHCESCGCC